MATLIGRELGGYRIEEELGRGAMGVVFKAKQISMDRYVALKFLPKRMAQDERVVARFLREARAAGQLNHPNLVNVHDAGVIEGLHFIAMEYVDGNSVHKNIRDKGPYSEKETLDIAGQIAAALKAAHNRGILHRDIKPDNFLIDTNGRVRLADLGLARFETAEDKDAEVTRDGMTLGTPHYMSPEQCSGSDVDARSDLYSLGASMYVLATGHTPYDAPTAAAVMVKTLTEPPATLKKLNPKLSFAFVALVDKMMAKDPAKRFQNAQEVVDAVERCKKGLFKGATKEHAKVEDVPMEPIIDEAPRYRLVLYGAAAAIVALLVAGFIIKARNDRAAVAAARNQPATSVKTENAQPVQPDPKTPAKTDEPKTPPKQEQAPKVAVQPDVPMEKPEHLAAVKKLSTLKVELGDMLQQDPDRAIARIEEFLKQHPGPRIANIAQEFITRAKDAKEKLGKDWAEAKDAAEQEVVAGNKAKAFHVLHAFAAAHAGTSQATLATGMMTGWVTDLRAEATRAADAGQYEQALDLLTLLQAFCLAEAKLPEEITAPVKKDLDRIAAEQKKMTSFAEADKRELAAILERASAAAKETDTITGKRYCFEDSAKICRDSLPIMKTVTFKKDLEGVAAMYTRAAQVLNRMRLTLGSLKTVPLASLGNYKDPVELSGWDDRGLSFKPKGLGDQTVTWKQVTPENLLQIAQAVKIATGTTSSDLLDAGALAYAAGDPNTALEKLEQAVAADPAAKPAADAVLRILKPPPDRETLAKLLFAEASAARAKKLSDAALKLQQRLVVEFADTEFVQKNRKQIQELGLPGGAETVAAKTPDKVKDPPPPDKKDATPPDKKTDKKDDKKDDAAIAELKKLGWTEVTGNWTQDPRRKTTFSVTGGGTLHVPFLDAAAQVTFQIEEGGSVGVYTRYLPDTAEIKAQRALFDDYNLVLGYGYGVHYVGGSATIFGDKSPAEISAGTTKGSYEKKAVPIKINALSAQPGVHRVAVIARGDHLEIYFDEKKRITDDKLRADGGVAIIVDGAAKIDSPMVQGK